MAKVIVITKLDNSSIVVDREDGNEYTLLPSSLIQKNVEGDFLTVRNDQGKLIDTFKVSEMKEVIRDSGSTVVPINDLDTLFFELTTYFFFRVTGGGSNSPAYELWKYNALNYTDLTTNVAPTADEGDIAYVQNSQGVWPVNRRIKGFYIYVSGVWEYGNQELQDQLILSQYKLKVSSADTMGDFLQQKAPNTEDIYSEIASPGSNEKLQFKIRERNLPFVSASNSPGLNDDITQTDGIGQPRHRVGQLWYNEAADVWYRANDLTAGSAIWERASLDFYASANSRDYNRPGQTTEGLINQQVNVFETYCSRSFIPKISDNYSILSSFVWSYNDGGQDFIVNLNVTDGSSFNETLTMRLEPQDTSGVGVVLNVIQGGLIVGNVNSGTNQRVPQFMSISDLNLVGGTEYTMSLSWTSSSPNDEATLYNGNVEVLQFTKS